MKTISIQIDNIINKELSLINNKINGLLLLEILKYKIIDNLKEINFSSINYQDDLVDSNYEDYIRKINVHNEHCVWNNSHEDRYHVILGVLDA